MMLMVISKSKLKKILIFILILAFIIGGIAYILKNKSQDTMNLLDMAGNTQPYTMGTVKNSGHVAITCNVDLGWEDEYIEKILEVLDKENVKITFAVTGKWAEKNKDMLLKMQDKGHEIANHGYQHINYDTLSYDENLNEIKKSQQIIDAATEKESKFFQAPSGAFCDETVKAANDLGYICYKWDVDTIDWMDKDNPDKIIERIKKKDIKDGSIVLMHPTKATTMCLDDIISIIRTKGYVPGRLSDVFSA
ncbi:MAG: polysaccharide deacetylase family protein [Intestinibacter bartlettii]|uniref:polysaccharide deacetylase family protein n=1 Tax=Intestinibacter bartlettii TaxID=261299 RepID=UPI0026F1B4D6|nr:polysaccharide deacetylase family protein [Intestinibacter bartlettii]MDO5009955.1 polysaccharide deacetylase family protein [Intestinibacter bartlettii]